MPPPQRETPPSDPHGATTGAVLSDGVVTLRCLRLADVAAHLAGEDEDQVRWLNEGHRSVPGRLPAWIRSNQREWLTGGPRRHFGVRDARSDALIGNVEAHLALPDLAPGEVNLSYAVFPAWRGRGVAVRAIHLVCDWLGFRTGHRTAVIRVDASNAPSARVAVAAGFTAVGEAGTGSGAQLLRYERCLHPRPDR